ncbi:MAG: ATP-binding protein [Candidatus Promineifilaceae bacterium]
MSNEYWPSGAVTFLFSDIEDSTRLWDQYGAAMRPALAAHDEILRTAVERHGGVVVKTTGDGIHAVFVSPSAALSAALDGQRARRDAAWSSIAPDTIRVRMGLHSGEAELRDGDYYGTAVNRAARLMAIAHGGQVLVSGTSARLVEGSLPEEITLLDLGEQQLKGLSRLTRVYQMQVPDLPQEFPSLRAAETTRGNLPQRPTSFIGRERELADIEKSLGETHLLTLTGPGGTGKTRLSLEAAALVQPRYEHGVWLVELAPVTDPEQVTTAVAGVFGLHGQSMEQTRGMLFDYLREKELLLVLDNCEHLVEACARLAADLIAACPRLTILASSREGLGVYGETTYHLPTLSLPAADSQTADETGQSDAVQLFVDRAAAAQRGFRLTDGNATAVAQIVRRLDGIPLAIELAAARLKAFTVEQVASRLDDRFRLLTGGSRTALPRQQTLRALIDWSYDLLDEEERDLFRRLAVFSGGWTFEAAEAIADLRQENLRGFGQGSDTDYAESKNLADLDVYELLPQLVSKSLVTREADPTPDNWPGDGPALEPRYTYLETIRQYARDRLVESGQVEAVRDRHFTYYESLADSFGFAPEPGAARRQGMQVVLEFDNLRAAIDWAIDRYPGRVLHLFWNLSFYLSNQLPGADFIEWTLSALSKLEALPPAQGPQSEETAEQRELAMQKGLAVLAMLYMFLGQLADASRTADRAIASLRHTAGHPFMLAMALFVRGQAAYFFEEPIVDELVGESMALIQSMEDQPAKRSLLAMVLTLSAVSEARNGDRDIAERRFHEVIAMLQSSESFFLPWAQFSLLVMMMEMGSELETVRAQYEKAVTDLRRAGSRRLAAMAESDWAHRLRHEGDLDEALAIYQRMLIEWRELGHRAAVANILENIAFVDRAQGRPQRAAIFFGAAERIREEIGQDMLRPEREEYERELAALQEMLDAGELERLLARGRAMGTDALIDLALDAAPELAT